MQFLCCNFVCNIIIGDLPVAACLPVQPLVKGLRIRLAEQEIVGVERPETTVRTLPDTLTARRVRLIRYPGDL